MVVALGALLITLAGCGTTTTTTRTTFPPLGSTPLPAGNTTNATKAEVVGALAAVGVQAVDAIRTYRPPEGALLAAAPRSILQAQLADDPDHGFIVIYALDSPNDAIAAAKDHEAYIATGPGTIQFPPGTQFVIRVLGSNVIFFSWLPAAAPDTQTTTIGQTLGGLGSGF